MEQSAYSIFATFCVLPTLLAVGIAFLLSGLRDARRAFHTPPAGRARAWLPIARACALLGAGAAFAAATMVALAFVLVCHLPSGALADAVCTDRIGALGSSLATLFAFVGLACGVVVVALGMMRGER